MFCSAAEIIFMLRLKMKFSYMSVRMIILHDFFLKYKILKFAFK